jgi:hypothetical protein
LNATSTRIASAAAAALAIAALAAFAAFRDTPPPAQASVPAQVAPHNDNVAGAENLAPAFSPPTSAALPIERRQSTVGATLEPGEPQPCSPIRASVWYTLHVEATAKIQLTTAGSDFNTVLGVYTWRGFDTSRPGAFPLDFLTCNDDAFTTSQSHVAFDGQAGVTYYIQAAGRDGAAGNLRIYADCLPACPPANDNVSSAANVERYAIPYRSTRVTNGATLEPGEPQPSCAPMGATVWYRVISHQTLTLRASTVGSDFDTVIAVYRQDNVVPSPPGGLSQVACNDNASGGTSDVTFTAEGGIVHWVQVGGRVTASGAPATGNLVLGIDCVPACPPENDNFRYAGTYAGARDVLHTEGATLQPGEPRPCGNIGHTVWYEFYADRPFNLQADTFGSDHDTVLAVYRVPDLYAGDLTFADLELIECNDDAAGTRQSRVTWTPGDAFSGYFIQVGGAGAAFGELHFNFDCVPAPCPPYNDDFDRAEYFDVPWSFPLQYYSDTRGATMQDGEPRGCGAIGRSVWYRIPGYNRATLVFDTAESDFDTAIAVYRSGGEVQDFSQIDQTHCATSSAGAKARVQFDLEPNAFYHVQMGGVNGAGGILQFSGDCIGACPPRNDNINSAEFVFAGSVSSIDTHGATLEPGEPQPCGGIDGTVWYRTHADHDGEFVITVDGANFAPVIAVYVIDSLSPAGGVGTPVTCVTGEAGAGARAPVDARGGFTYMVQIGGVDGARGNARFVIECNPEACPIVPLEEGGGVAIPGGTIIGPDTGSGGHATRR